MHQKLLTIKDTLLSSQTSHPPQQSPHKPCRNHAETITRRPDQPYHTNPETTKPRSQNQPAEPANHTTTKAAARKTIPAQTRSHNPAHTSRNHHNHQRSQQFPAPQQDPKKPKHSSHKRQIMPPATPPKEPPELPPTPHPQARSQKHTLHTPPPPTQTHKTAASSPRAYLPRRCPSRDLSSR